MQQVIRLLFFGFASMALGSGVAAAGNVVVPPILARGAPAQTASNMTTLVASELEFTGEFDEVNQLTKRPPQLGTNCLGSSPCLAGIAKQGGATTLLAGKVTKYGAEYEVSLTFLDNSKIVRVVKRRMPTDPAAVADELAYMVRHAVTGVDPAQKAAADKVSGFEGGGIALMDDEDEDDDDDLLMSAPDVPASSDPMYGDDPDEFEEEEEDPDDGYGIAGGVVGAAAVAAASRASDPLSEDPIEPETRYSDDLDEAPAPVRTPRQRAKREPPPRQSRAPRARGPQRSSASTFDLTGRIGFAKFQFLNFLTYGVEGGFQVTPNFAVLAGLEAYSTRRNIPPELVPAGLPAVQWNTLVPLSASGVYRPDEGPMRPFFGGGLQLIPGYVKGAQSLAFGLRGIGGMDYQLSDNFGLSVSGSAGFWAGSDWYRIQNLMNTGFSAQFSAGTLLLF
jgi:hypothetical protein